MASTHRWDQAQEVWAGASVGHRLESFIDCFSLATFRYNEHHVEFASLHGVAPHLLATPGDHDRVAKGSANQAAGRPLPPRSLRTSPRPGWTKE